MASRELTLKTYIIINGKKELWYEIDRNRNVTWHLPKDITEKYRNKMLDNIGNNMSRYINTHPESSLWGATN